jgi:hypothetical protein
MLNRLAIRGTASCVVSNEKAQFIQFNLIFPQLSPLPHGILLVRSHQPAVLTGTTLIEGKFVECAGELIHDDGHLYLECHYLVTNFEERARDAFRGRQKQEATNGTPIDIKT